MFRKAYAIASQFTRPVVLSKLDGGGNCTASIGSYVVVNSEGWIVTAYHILDQFHKLGEQTVAVQAFEAEHARLTNDPTLTKRERQSQIRSLSWPAKTDARRHSAWWGRDDMQIATWAGIQAIDLAVAKLEPFDPAWITKYPTFKDPSKAVEPGVSLCKLGFPFHTITPSWNDVSARFEFPAGALPLPLFPIDGIFTRTVELRIPSAPAAYPLQWLETSSPGLRGQSGGPTFDVEGTVWGIQARTFPYPLGFEEAGAKNQFLNVGLGVHVATVLRFFDERGIKYSLSPY